LGVTFFGNAFFIACFLAAGDFFGDNDFRGDAPAISVFADSSPEGVAVASDDGLAGERLAGDFFVARFEVFLVWDFAATDRFAPAFLPLGLAAVSPDDSWLEVTFVLISGLLAAVGSLFFGDTDRDRAGDDFFGDFADAFVLPFAGDFFFGALLAPRFGATFFGDADLLLLGGLEPSVVCVDSTGSSISLLFWLSIWLLPTWAMFSVLAPFLPLGLAATAFFLAGLALDAAVCDAVRFGAFFGLLFPATASPVTASDDFDLVDFLGIFTTLFVTQYLIRKYATNSVRQSLVQR
jgi:hypothetical protein